MKVTNELNLPKAFVNAVTTERHNKPGCYSATTLLHGVKETILTERHYDELTVDASDQIWAVFGTAVHSIFEKQNDEGFKEEYFEIPVHNSKVTGRVDYYDLENEVIFDYKTASVWKVKFNDFADWKKQGLVYSWLMKKNGLNVKKCKFMALLKDHSKTEAKRNADYPQKPVYIYEFDVTEKDLKEIELFIYNKVKELEIASTYDDDEIPECNCEERWATADKWAVMKNGRKTAVRVFDTEEEANGKLAELKGDYVEHRKGENKKCSEYCVCCEFCHFYKMNCKA